MEVIGLAASVITLTELAEKGLKFRRHFKNATEELSLAVLRVESLSINLNELRRIQHDLGDQRHVQDETSKYVSRGIINAVSTLDRIYRLLPRAIPNPSQSSTKNRLRWIVSDKAMYEELMDVLAQTEISINATFNILTWQENRLRQERRLTHETDQLVTKITAESTPDAQVPLTKVVIDHALALPNTIHMSTCSSVTTKQHRWRLANILRTSAYTASSHSSTWVSSLLVHLPAHLCLKADLMLRSQQYSHSTVFSLDGARLSICTMVPRSSPFMAAAAEGSIPKMQQLISARMASPHEVADNGVTPLCLAIQAGHASAVDFLLCNGVNVNESFGRKQTSALAWALKHRYLDVVNALLRHGASFHHLSIHGWSPLFYLWSQAWPQTQPAAEFINMLHRNDFEYRYLHDGLRDTGGWSLLQRAAVFGTPEDVRVLMRTGVDIFQCVDSLGWTVLHSVVSYGVFANFEVLFPSFNMVAGHENAIESPDKRNWTLLHIAIEGGHEQMVRALLTLGASWKRPTDPVFAGVPDCLWGISCTPLRLALAYGEDKYRWLVRAIDEIVLDVVDQDEWVDAMEYIWYDAM